MVLSPSSNGEANTGIQDGIRELSSNTIYRKDDVLQ